MARFRIELEDSKKVKKWENLREIKNGKRPTSHRYDRLPLLRSRPGGVQQELVVWDLPVQRYDFISICQNKFVGLFHRF